MVYHKELQRSCPEGERWILRAGKSKLLRCGGYAVRSTLTSHMPRILTYLSTRALFVLHLILAIYSMLFAPPHSTDDDEQSISSTGKGRASDMPTEREWEMVRIPDTPGTVGGMKSPITPRTRAFNDLDGGYAASGGQQLPAWTMNRQEKMPWSH
jgi:hypothetical protein